MTTMSKEYMRDYRAKQAVSRGGLLPFQQRFLDTLCRQNDPPDVCSLSIGRGTGKSWLAGKILARSISPGDQLFVSGAENVLLAASREQATIVLGFVKDFLEGCDGFRWRIGGVTHVETGTAIKIISSDSKRALGLGARTRFIVADEPSAWPKTAGLRLWNAVLGSLGKNRTQLVVIGTLAPSPTSGPGAWWPAHIAEGCGDGRYTLLIAADPERWRDWAEVERVNPCMSVNPFLKRRIEREYKRALVSERAAIPFRQYRLNIGGGESTGEQPLITSAEWARVCARPVPECEGTPVIGIDLGGTRSWSAACGIWPTGRIESWAIAPGLPSLAEQEREDQLADGSYQELVKEGGLRVDEGQHVPGVDSLLARIWAWQPSGIVCDSYRSAELQSVVGSRVRIIERSRSGGEATSNVQALRKLLLDTASGVTQESRALLAAAFEQTNLVIDNAGLTKVVKRDQRRSRDDAAMSLLLAAGEQARRPAPVKWRAAAISASGEVTWY